MSLPILPSQAKPTSGPLPTITNANISLPYASGGGGGGGGPNPSVSSLTLAAGGQINLNASASQVGALNLEFNSTLAQGSYIAFQVDQGPGGLIGMAYNPPTSTIQVEYFSETGGPVAASGFSMGLANISSLNVSSINGAAPGGGGLFQSTFTAVPCPQNASTTLLAMPAGQFGYNGLLTGTSATGYLSGFLNTVSNSAGPFYFGQIIEAPQGQPPNALPCQMVINTGDSGLSTIKLIVANTSSQPATFTGVVSKLY